MSAADCSSSTGKPATPPHLTGHARVDWDPDRAAAVPGAQRLVDFDVERVVQIAGGSPLRWSFGTHLWFNPAVLGRSWEGPRG